MGKQEDHHHGKPEPRDGFSTRFIRHRHRRDEDQKSYERGQDKCRVLAHRPVKASGAGTRPDPRSGLRCFHPHRDTATIPMSANTWAPTRYGTTRTSLHVLQGETCCQGIDDLIVSRAELTIRGVHGQRV